MNARTLAFLRFELRRALRNHGIVITSMIVPVVLYLANFHSPNAAIGGVAWSRYFLASMAVYASISAALVVGGMLPLERRSGWTHQLRLASLGPGQYLTAKLVAGGLYAVPPALLITLLGLLTAHETTDSALLLPVVVIAGSVPFAAVGLTAGYLSNERTIQAVLPLLIVSLSALGGLWWPVAAMPAPLQWLSQVMPTRHLATVTRAVIQHSPPPPSSVAALIAFAALSAGVLGFLYRRDQAQVTSAW